MLCFSLPGEISRQMKYSEFEDDSNSDSSDFYLNELVCNEGGSIFRKISLHLDLLT